jgi:thiopurine S-methyltransferase
MDGPPFPISPDRVEELFAGDFRITLLEKRDGLNASQNLKKRGLTALQEMAWKLVRR